MKKKWWIVLGVLVLAAVVAVAAVLLLRWPPLVRTDGIESVVVTVTGKGHKELTDPHQQQEVLKLINRAKREETTENAAKGWVMAVYVYYEDGSRNSVFFMPLLEEPASGETGVTHPIGYHMSLHTGGNYFIENGTVDTLFELCDSNELPYTLGILPSERMYEAGLIDPRHD